MCQSWATLGMEGVLMCVGGYRVQAAGGRAARCGRTAGTRARGQQAQA